MFDRSILPLNTPFNDIEQTAEFPTLYKETKTGDFQTSKIFVNGNIIKTIHGLETGKKQEAICEIFTPKSQETLFYQAVFDARSDYNKKLDQGYALVKSKASELDFRPMLAQKYHEKKKKVLLAVNSGELLYSQAKLNGIRGNLLIKNNKTILQSRKGKELVGQQHINDAYNQLMNSISFLNKNVVLDGELYSHGKSLQKISGDARREENSNKLKFYDSDIFEVTSPDLTYKERYIDSDVLTAIKELCSNDPDFPIRFVDELYKTRAIWKKDGKKLTEEDLDNLVNERRTDAEQNKFEGLMIRMNNSPYQINKRANCLLKSKSFQDEEFEIVDVITPDTGKDAGAAIFVCKLPGIDSKQFNVTPIGTFEERSNYYNDRVNLIGKMLTVKFVEKSEDGTPTHLNGIAVRDYE